MNDKQSSAPPECRHLTQPDKRLGDAGGDVDDRAGPSRSPHPIKSMRRQPGAMLVVGQLAGLPSK